MSRRALTLLLAGILAGGLLASATVTPVPYVAYKPGPTFDTLGEVGGTPVIAIEGRETFPTDGQLDLTTISVVPRLTLLQAVSGWLDDDRAVVPREFVYPPGQTDAEVNRRNEERKLESENAATIAALNQLGVPFTLSVEVQRVEPGLPAEGELEPGDVLTAVDGRPVEGSAQLRELISGRPPGTDVRIGYQREGEPAETTITTTRPESGEDRSIIGILLAERPEYPFTVTITLQRVGGPSAGLMFALGIIDKLGPESLTGGRYIAGSGEISGDGQVGAIGGIQQKLAASRDKGAEVFLVPAGNFAEAAERAPEGLLLVRVSTLQEALGALEVLREGGEPTTC